jgi:hypothetical protein
VQQFLETFDVSRYWPLSCVELSTVSIPDVPDCDRLMEEADRSLTREMTNNLNATYKTEGSRAWLMQQPTFVEAFTAAKARIRAMDYRFVEEANQNRQALLETY